MSVQLCAQANEVLASLQQATMLAWIAHLSSWLAATWSTGQHMAGKSNCSWSTQWLARDMGGLLAAVCESRI
jgi:hypothetical protein